MSSIVPGPKKKLEEDITAARAGEKPLDASALNPSTPRHQELTGLDDWPETLRATVEAEHTRVTALETNRRRTADHTVPAVVHGLDELLNQLADHLQSAKPGLFSKPSPATELDQVAELLGIPPDEINPTPGRGDYRTALRTIKQLRVQLKDIEATPDHSRLTRLVTFTIRLAVILDAAPGPATTLSPTALTRFAEATSDFQWDATFAQKLEFWQEIRRTLATP